MSAATGSAHRWLAGTAVAPDAQVSIVEGGIAFARRTAVSHHVLDAAEITAKGETTLAARWLCGGRSVDAVLANDEEQVDCLSCRLAAALPQTPCVYFAWGADDSLLYVGSSINVATRIRQHMYSTSWWQEVRRITTEAHDSELAARRAELAHIGEAPGKYNREGRRPEVREISDLGFVIGGKA